MRHRCGCRHACSSYAHGLCAACDSYGSGWWQCCSLADPRRCQQPTLITTTRSSTTSRRVVGGHLMRCTILFPDPCLSLGEHGLTPCRIDQGIDFSLNFLGGEQPIPESMPGRLDRTDVLVRLDPQTNSKASCIHSQEHSSLSCHLVNPMHDLYTF